MFQCGRYGCAAAVLLSVGLVPAFADGVKPAETIEGWGLIAEPVGDCAFDHNEGKVTIQVPGAYHDLWPGQGQVNAPLVLQEVAGEGMIRELPVFQRISSVPTNRQTWMTADNLGHVGMPN